jgi:hypothetical protein
MEACTKPILAVGAPSGLMSGAGITQVKYLFSVSFSSSSPSSYSSSSSFVLGWGSRGVARMEEGNDGRFPLITRKAHDEDDHEDDDHDHQENERVRHRASAFDTQ